MKIFADTEANSLDNDSRIILRYSQPTFNHVNTDYFYLLKDGNHLIWATKGYFPPLNGKPEKWVGGSEVEFPKQGFLWFIIAIEEKFMKTEAEGGLKKAAFTYSEIIEGEKLAIKRQFGVPGYGLMNFSREEYLFQQTPQLAEFTDTMLFDNGLLAQLRVIADKITAGTL